jgi:peptidoglycan/LPS O-acetylase OafA/YrhL
MHYRPEVDGLRTIAVMSVIIYHAEFEQKSTTLLPGGFLGVDIFFVISGFLITSLIIGEYHKTAYFSIARFYERRARRLIPALLLVSICSFPLAWIYLLPEHLVDYSYSIIASQFFVSNFYWLHSLQQYGAESALLKPFLHTWSLAIEEQYYIFFPPILILMLSKFPQRITPILCGAILISFVYAETINTELSSFAFYMLPTRLWELLSGGLLAYILIRNPRTLKDINFSTFFPKIGLLLIVTSVILIEFENNHPGLITVPSIIGTLLIIGFARKEELTTRLLSSKPFVWIGLISYSLYLWHYPIFAFGRISVEQPELEDKLLWIAITFILAFTSYILVERPFRNKNRISLNRLISIIIVASFVFITVNYLVIANEGVPSRMPKILSTIETNLDKTRVCPPKEKFCTINSESDTQIFLIGDSHMFPLEKPLSTIAEQESYSLTILNKAGCQYIRNLQRVEKKTGKLSKGCSIDFQESRRKVLLKAKPSIVIIGGRLPLILNESRFDTKEGKKEGSMKDFMQDADQTLQSFKSRQAAIRNAYSDTLLELAEYGHRVILIYPVPEAGWNIPKIILAQFKKTPLGMNKFIKDTPITTSYEVYQNRNRDGFNLLNSVNHKNIERVYPHDLFCDKQIIGRCITHNEQNVFYRDDDHLSFRGAELLAQKIKEKL